jgi:hypothetical protein
VNTTWKASGVRHSWRHFHLFDLHTPLPDSPGPKIAMSGPHRIGAGVQLSSEAAGLHATEGDIFTGKGRVSRRMRND